MAPSGTLETASSGTPAGSDGVGGSTAKAALWWPTSREDIDIRCLPTRPGKAVQLELKTTKVAGAGLHDVLVDLGQLWEYRRRPLGHQPFYAFPWPGWRGNLTAAALSGGRPVTELAFSRGGRGWWFADWMVLLTAERVAAVLHRELAAHGSGKRGNRERLVRFDVTHSTATPVVTWGSGSGATPRPIRWREFWAKLEQCGGAAVAAANPSPGAHHPRCRGPIPTRGGGQVDHCGQGHAGRAAMGQR